MIWETKFMKLLKRREFNYYYLFSRDYLLVISSHVKLLMEFLMIFFLFFQSHCHFNLLLLIKIFGWYFYRKLPTK
jgi:hypothetical protein